VDKQGAIAPGTLFAQRSQKDTLRSLRLNVVAVLDDFDVGGFRLDVGTDVPRSVFVSREWLTSEMGKEGKANALIVESPSVDDKDLRASLASTCILADYGLKVAPNAQQGYLSLQSDEMLLDEQQLRDGREAATQCGARQALTSVYLADRIRKVNGSAPGLVYSVVAAVQPLSPFRFAQGGGAQLGDDGVWLNTWAAEDLQASLGDRLEVSYLTPQPDGTYRTSKIRLTLKGIVDMSGPSGDRNLVPSFEGITDAGSIDEWNTPFPIDLSFVTERDESYWERYKTTPKAFVSLNAARSMWSRNPTSPATAWVTSLRLAPPPGIDLTTLKQRFERGLTQRLSPQRSGMAFLPVRRIALESAKGSTDFGQLFMAMSFFIVLSGAGLAGMLMKLSTERRAAETGVMLACGFTPKTAVLVLLGEGAVLTLAGMALGLPLGVLYAWGIIAALKSWWIGAIGTSPLWLHVSLGSVMTGAFSGLLVGLASLVSSAVRLRKTDTLQLLAGWQAIRSLPSGRRDGRSKLILLVSLVMAVALVLLPTSSAQASYFGSGAALLVVGMSVVNLALIRAMRVRMSVPTLAGLAFRSAAANRFRSLLVVGLLACSGFVIITVAANVRDFSNADLSGRDSGAGGFALRAVSSSPLHYDLASHAGRASLGFSPDDEKVFVGVRVVPFLMSSGEDISCLNLAKPAYPRVLAVSRQMGERGGFRIKSALSAGNPWSLLQADDGGGLPIFGDANSVMWNLHSGLGKVYTMPGGDRASIQMRFAGLISQSIFAAELLMSEEHFRRVFPGAIEPRYFLIETPNGREDAVASALRRNLGRLGIEVRSTRELLNSYIGVQNTYLSMFLALGG
ncbi:MAG: ABC transporter permease, partial [Armatimonadota bacterium]